MRSDVAVTPDLETEMLALVANIPPTEIVNPASLARDLGRPVRDVVEVTDRLRLAGRWPWPAGRRGLAARIAAEACRPKCRRSPAPRPLTPEEIEAEQSRRRVAQGYLHPSHGRREVSPESARIESRRLLHAWRSGPAALYRLVYGRETMEAVDNGVIGRREW